MKRVQFLPLLSASAVIVFCHYGCTDVPIEESSVTSPEPDVAAPVSSADEPAFVALTPTEYNFTIADMLALPRNGSQWPDPPALADQLNPAPGDKLGLFMSPPIKTPPWPFAFPKETGVDGFESMVDGQSPSPYGVEQLQKAAIHFAPWILVSPVFWTCDNLTELGSEDANACGWNSLMRFAQRAWRRPLDSEELSRLKSLYDSLLIELSVEEAAVLTVTGILQAPAFVFRIEKGKRTTETEPSLALSNWELASRLSYFLWDTMPDPELFQAAARGELQSEDGIEAQARRMLADPRARAAIVHFHHQWLETDTVLKIAPAQRMYGPFFGLATAPALDTTDDGSWPAVINPIRQSMLAETEAFISHVIFEGDGSFEALLSSTDGFMSSHTASIYGDGVIDRPGETITVAFGQVTGLGSTSSLQLMPVTWPAAERAGLLTLPSVLAIGAHPVHGAPILRGKRIVERIACLHFGAPPPGAEGSAPPDTADADATNRERTHLATSSAECSGCHNILNPPGFAYEHYDALGHWRATDNGSPVDASGTLQLGSESFTFEDGVDFALQLSQSARVRSCYVTHWARYASGLYVPDGSDALKPLIDAFQTNDNIQDLLVAIVKSRLFTHRQVMTAETK